MSSDVAPEVVAFGEPLVAFYPAGEGEEQGSELDSPADASLPARYRLTWGGDASNFSLATVKLGRSCALLTRVGSDLFGRGFREVWERNGVDTRLVQTDAAHRTGIYFAVFSGGRHELAYYRADSAATHVDGAEIDWTLVDGARVVHSSGIAQAISPATAQLSFRLFEAAKARGALVSYDVNYRPTLWAPEQAREIALRTIERYVDILEITDEEMGMLGLGERPEELLEHLPRVPDYCVIKRGLKGSCLFTRGERHSFGAFPVAVRDTVGAGDAYDAALVAAILEGRGAPDAVRFASAAGALTCTGVGPLERQPRRSDIDRFLHENPDPLLQGGNHEGT